MAREANAAELGRLLAALRTSRGLTQEELARRVGNRSASAISRVEKADDRVPRASTLRRLANALDLDEAETREVFALGGLDVDMPRPSHHRDAVRQLLNQCAAATSRTPHELVALESEELFEPERVMQRYDAAEAAVKLLRVRAGQPETRGPYAVGISLVGGDDFFNEEQRGQWRAALQLVLSQRLPIIQIFELAGASDAMATIKEVLDLLGPDPPGKYEARYFTSEPSRTSPYNFIVAPGLGGLLFFNSSYRDTGAGPDTAYTFRGGPGSSLLESQFDRLERKESRRLLKVLRQGWQETNEAAALDRALEWESDLARDEESLGDRLQVARGLSRLLVPDNLWLETVESAWQGHDLAAHTIHRYELIRRRRRAAFEAQMHRFRYRTITTKSAVEDLVKGDASTIDTMLGGPARRPLPMTVRRRALETLVDYLDNGYEVALLESGQLLAQIPIFEWIVKDKQAVHLEARNEKNDVLRVTLMPHLVVDAFKEFFDDVWQRLPVPATDQTQVKAYLRLQLSLLADGSLED